MHLLTQVAQINISQVSNPHKCLLCEVEILGQQSIDPESSPVLFCDSDACNFISHVEILLLKESVEGR
jgi:hypothetical protein